MKKFDFCHIAPIKLLETVQLFTNQKTHLVLAHLVEQDHFYSVFYRTLSERGHTIIMDNSGFEHYKQSKPYYTTEQLITLGKAVGADYIVMPDFPNRPAQEGIDYARNAAPLLKREGFNTFFVPQSEIGQLDDLRYAFNWVLSEEGKSLVDYVGFSILAIPNAYGVEQGNQLQRFNARWAFMNSMRPWFHKNRELNYPKKIHMLGMVDGPREIKLLSDFHKYIDSWDSSAAVWAGLLGKAFDKSPTGLQDGKIETEVDFHHDKISLTAVNTALYNITVIENMISSYNEDNGEGYIPWA